MSTNVQILTPVNISLINQAHRIWQKVEQEIDKEILEKLELDIGREYLPDFH